MSVPFIAKNNSIAIPNKTARKCPGGNTKPPDSEKKYQNFVFTLFTDAPPTLVVDKIKYLCFGEEVCPTTGSKHWQSFVTMKNSMTFSAFRKFRKKWLNVECWCEPMYGRLEDSERYCSKDAKYNELGTKPAQGKRSDLIALKDRIMTGEISVDQICVEDPMAYHQYGRTLNRLEDIAMRRVRRSEMTKAKWYWGRTGVGKSHAAFEGTTWQNSFIWEDDNGWWDGYCQQEIVIINDFRGQIPYDRMLKIIDKWPCDVPRRGREKMPFTSKTVIITSSLPPHEVYHNRNERDHIDQLLDRLEVIHLEGENMRHRV